MGRLPGVALKDRPTTHLAYDSLQKAFSLLSEEYNLKPKEEPRYSLTQFSGGKSTVHREPRSTCESLQLPKGRIMLTKSSRDVDLDFQTVLVDGRFIATYNDQLEIRYAVSNEYRQVQKRFLAGQNNPVAQDIRKFWKTQRYFPMMERWELLCFETSPNDNSAKEISDFVSAHIPKD